MESWRRLIAGPDHAAASDMPLVSSRGTTGLGYPYRRRECSDSRRHQDQCDISCGSMMPAGSLRKPLIDYRSVLFHTTHLAEPSPHSASRCVYDQLAIAACAQWVWAV